MADAPQRKCSGVRVNLCSTRGTVVGRLISMAALLAATGCGSTKPQPVAPPPPQNTTRAKAGLRGADELMQQVVETYRGLSSYQDEGVVLSHWVNKPTPDQLHFKTYFRKPADFASSGFRIIRTRNCGTSKPASGLVQHAGHIQLVGQAIRDRDAAGPGVCNRGRHGRDDPTCGAPVELRRRRQAELEPRASVARERGW
jgi:hypothetical protein